MPDEGWTPRSWVALILGAVVLVFVAGSLTFRLWHPDAPVSEVGVGAWKELTLGIVGGLLVWIGRDKNA